MKLVMNAHLVIANLVFFLLVSSAVAMLGQSTLPERSKLYGMDYDNVWVAVVEVIEEREEGIRSLNKEDGVIETGFHMIDVERLRAIANIRASETHWAKGRYRLHIALLPVANSETKVTVIPSIMGWRVWSGLQGEDQPAPMAPAAWVPLQSNGALEEEIFNEVSKKLR